MAKRDSDLRVEEIVGASVHDSDGRVVGRIEELRAEREGEHWVVTAYDIGPAALFERLAVRHLGVTWSGRPAGYRARWDQIDLTDSQAPRLTCAVSELERLRR